MIRVYLCTYNGARFIGEQLESLARQTCQDFDLLVSDDGSRDDTLQIVESFRGRVGQGIFIQQGPKRGSAANFLATLASDDCGHDHYAFCDQDDIWENDKLERALAWFKTIAEDKPALYGARVRIVDQDNKALGLSALPRKQLTFANALVQNFTGGNAMVFNRAAHTQIRQSLNGLNLEIIPVHDWWAYLIISGTGGIVYCDDYASLRYRQHDGNVIGALTGWKAFTNRWNRLYGEHARRWNTRNVEALSQHMELLTEESRKLLQHFRIGRDTALTQRLAYALFGKEVYRQTALGQIGLVLGLAMRKI